MCFFASLPYPPGPGTQGLLRNRSPGISAESTPVHPVSHSLDDSPGQAPPPSLNPRPPAPPSSTTPLQSVASPPASQRRQELLCPGAPTLKPPSGGGAPPASPVEPVPAPHRRVLTSPLCLLRKPSIMHALSSDTRPLPCVPLHPLIPLAGPQAPPSSPHRPAATCSPGLPGSPGPPLQLTSARPPPSACFVPRSYQSTMLRSPTAPPP